MDSGRIPAPAKGTSPLPGPPSSGRFKGDSWQRPTPPPSACLAAPQSILDDKLRCPFEWSNLRDLQDSEALVHGKTKDPPLVALAPPISAAL